MAAFRYSIFSIDELDFGNAESPIVRESEFNIHKITWQRETTHLNNAFD
jgi:hypothetical protein